MPNQHVEVGHDVCDVGVEMLSNCFCQDFPSLATNSECPGGSATGRCRFFRKPQFQ